MSFRFLATAWKSSLEGSTVTVVSAVAAPPVPVPVRRKPSGVETVTDGAMKVATRVFALVRVTAGPEVWVQAALAWPSFAVGWVLTFFGIMRELSASILLYSVGSEVLSVVLLKLWTNGRAEEVSVIGLMMMLLVILFRWVQLRVIKQRISTL